MPTKTEIEFAEIKGYASYEEYLADDQPLVTDATPTPAVTDADIVAKVREKLTEEESERFSNEDIEGHINYHRKDNSLRETANSLAADLKKRFKRQEASKEASRVQKP